VALVPDIQHFWTEFNPYMAEGTAEWIWPVGENEHYWGYSVRPFQFNMDVEVVRQWTTSDNGNQFFEHFMVTVRHVIPNANGGLLRFSAFAAIGS
jgi:hypothetical protein